MEPQIVIRVGDEGDCVEIGWTGSEWVPVSGHPGAAAEMCRTARAQGERSEVGDHHLPPMVAAAVRAAGLLGGKVTKCPEFPPLADGDVS